MGNYPIPNIANECRVVEYKLTPDELKKMLSNLKPEVKLVSAELTIKRLREELAKEKHARLLLEKELERIKQTPVPDISVYQQKIAQQEELILGLIKAMKLLFESDIIRKTIEELEARK